jgi:hypothetical protein
LYSFFVDAFLISMAINHHMQSSSCMSHGMLFHLAATAALQCRAHAASAAMFPLAHQARHACIGSLVAPMHSTALQRNVILCGKFFITQAARSQQERGSGAQGAQQHAARHMPCFGR